MDNSSASSGRPTSGPRAFWYGLINYEQRVPTAADLKLERMRALLARLGNPHRHVRILHIAGSKGKGSTAAMLATVLQRAGYRVGLFTSPHLCRVEERFQVDGRPISPTELDGLLEEVRECAQWYALSGLTFFEVATAVGFLHFVRRRVDVAVLEVGLGGRLDSTNVCQPAAALITSISFDHTDLLGHRLASIAREKAGIIKPGRPTLSGVRVPEAREVIEEVCRQRHSPLQQLGVDFHYEYEPGQMTATGLLKPRVHVTTKERTWPALELNLLGEHQAANAALVIACVAELRRQGWKIAADAVAAGLAEVVWPARMEIVGRQPWIILDCAHNVASAHAVVETLLSTFPPQRRLLIFGGSSDKDLAGMLEVLAPHFALAFLTRYSNNPRAVAPERLVEMLRASSDLPATICPTPAAALAAARSHASPDDLICITGSVFLAGELRPVLVTTLPV